MENTPKKKNRPHILVIILFSLIPLTVITYFILQIIFPNLFNTMPTGEVQVVRPDR
ncbi:hypothetical protein [Chryseobacterium sp. Leaf180]|jgi:hypothetical protein|uniref:hypothetical protein n=1 Tax=Chryseobacterium sp. Leaf180 TaxID=1736289 RepID=UPI000B1AD9B5|nr:hypothetical protein [Chryseobacterium sp. Leaf180]